MGARFGRHLRASQRQLRRTHTDHGIATSDFGKRPHRCRRTRIVHGFCDSSKAKAGVQQRLSWTMRWCRTTAMIFIVAELNRCWEVTQDQDKASKIEKAQFETKRDAKFMLYTHSPIARTFFCTTRAHLVCAHFAHIFLRVTHTHGS